MIEFRLLNNTRDFRDIADEIGLYVQSIGGIFSVHRYHVSFLVPIKEILFLQIKYPILEMEAYVW